MGVDHWVLDNGLEVPVEVAREEYEEDMRKIDAYLGQDE
jgi:hypothetical protein